MNVLFFCHGDFASNSMGQIVGFAAGLRELGWQCAAATVPFAGQFAAEALERCILPLGFVEPARLPELMRLDDALVQPGREDAFNRYRLPSKLPEFFASGRPVVLPAANVGLQVRPERDALILKTGTPEEIAECCQRIFANTSLAQTLAAGGVAFARRHFDSMTNTRRLARFYRSL